MIHRPQVLHYQLILDVELVQGKQFGEDILAHLHDVFRFDEGTILQAADDEEEDVLADRLHLHTIDIHSSDLEETPHVFKNIDEEQPKLIRRFLNAGLVVYELLLQFLTLEGFLSLLQLGLVGSADLHDALELVYLRVEDVDLVPDDVAVDVLVQLQGSVYEDFYLLPDITEQQVIGEGQGTGYCLRLLLFVELVGHLELQVSLEHQSIGLFAFVDALQAK